MDHDDTAPPPDPSLGDAEGERLFDRVRGWIDVHRHIDEGLYSLALQVVATEAGALFNPIDREVIDAGTHLDAIDHTAVYLAPNPFSEAEKEAVLGLLDLLHGAQVPSLVERFAEFTAKQDLFARVQAG